MAAALSAGLAAAACNPSAGEGSEAGNSDPDARSNPAPNRSNEFVQVVNVETRTVETTDFTTFVSITGAVEAFNDVVVSAEESGAIERFYVPKGSGVRAGQPIAKIDDRVLAAQVKEARALADLAAERFERQRQLWEDEEIGSEIAFLEAKYDSEAATARLQNLDARLARTVLRAPISGIFDQRFVDAGEMVVPGTPVARVIEVDRLKVVGGVPERFGPFVKSGGQARVTLDVLASRAFEGRIGYVGAAVEVSSRTFPIEIVLANPERVVKPQMVANVEVATQRLENVIVVPQDVVLRTEFGYEVFVAVERDGGLVAESRTVRLGPSFEDEVVIEQGLEPGDELIVVGHQMVDPGNRLRIVGSAEAGETDPGDAS
jgi:RND family efflux transporter MFP subunit